MLSDDTVIIEKDVSERDKYGRLLMYVYSSDGKSVQEELLKNGLARVAYVFEPNIKYVDRYREIEKKAKEKGIGIWSVDGYAHIGHKHGYHTDVFKEHEKENASVDKKQSFSDGDSFTPDAYGNCDGYIKGNHSSSGDWIYYVPAGQYYDVTKAEECFRTEDAAEVAGYRQSGR